MKAPLLIVSKFWRTETQSGAFICTILERLIEVMKEEIWKAIPGYEGYYEASNTGKYRSLDRIVTRSDGINMHIKGKELKFSHGLDDYAIMNLTKDGKSYGVLAHRIICKLFMPDFDPSLTVNHKDGNKFNNSIDNLEMMTIQENIHHFCTSPVFEEKRRYRSELTSKLHKGRKKTPEEIAKQRKGLMKYLETHPGVRKGAVIDDELRRKISFGEGTHIKCIETEQYFTSYKSAARYFNVDITTVISWCQRGINKKGGN